jgi:hypothetical protein
VPQRPNVEDPEGWTSTCLGALCWGRVEPLNPASPPAPLNNRDGGGRACFSAGLLARRGNGSRSLIDARSCMPQMMGLTPSRS